MRVIAGEFRSRRLKTLPGGAVRPTPDRLREALFNVLAPHLEGSSFLDAFAGCGAVGIEALSRGASPVIFVESGRAAAALIRENLRSLGVTEGVEVHEGRASVWLERTVADIVFLDPPYDRPREYETALEVLGRRPPPLVIAQHASRRELPGQAGRLRRVRVLRQGDNSLSFYEPDPP
jgi:16S rRNA (guanine(966)-N(2))-methyltransferase RsmD